MLRGALWLWRRFSDFCNLDWVVALFGGWRVVGGGIAAFFTGGIALGESLPLSGVLLVVLATFVLTLAGWAVGLWLLRQYRPIPKDHEPIDALEKEFVPLKEAMGKAYGTLRQTKFKDMLPQKAWDVGDPLSFCAEIMAQRGLPIYGMYQHSSVLELIGAAEVDQLHFEKEATELGETFGGGRYANLQVKAADLAKLLASMVEENQ
jgi:hypothetical protein